MEAQKKRNFWKWHVLFYTVMALTIGVLGYRINTLNKIVENEKILILAKEYDILNHARAAALDKSLVTLKLLECKGVKRDKLDSIMIVLHHANEKIAKRDSAFMIERKRQLDNWYK